MQTNPTPEEARETWCTALLSGDYRQTVGKLRTTGGHCCLGVACDVFQHQVRGKWSEPYAVITDGEAAPHAYDFATPNYREQNVLPLALVRLLALHDHEGSFNPRELPDELRGKLLKWDPSLLTNHYTTLAGLNDQGVPFEVIVEIVRAAPPSLFGREG